MNLLLTSVLGVVALAVVYRYYEHRYIRLTPTENWKCDKVLNGIADGPEDFALSKQHQILFISSHNRRSMSSVGTILAVDTRTGEPMDITISNPPKNFRPHGLAIFEKDTRSTMFAISHRGELDIPHSVEVFDYSPTDARLEHIRTLSSPLLASPNDLIALGFNELLVSNDHCEANVLQKLYHLAVGYACAETVHFDGTGWHSLHDPVSFGNGLIIGKDNMGAKHLIRAAAATYTLYNYSFAHNGANKPGANRVDIDLNFAETLPLSPDNIEYDEFSGGLLIAGHPSTTRFVIDAILQVPAPSAVILYFGLNDYRVLYYSDGTEIAASSVAVRTNETTYFIGQVFNPYILRCSA